MPEEGCGRKQWITRGHQMIAIATLAAMIIGAWISLSNSVSSLSESQRNGSEQIHNLQTTVSALATSGQVVGVLDNRAKRDEQDISDLRSAQSAMTTQINTVTQQLAVIDSKLGELLAKQKGR